MTAQLRERHRQLEGSDQ